MKKISSQLLYIRLIVVFFVILIPFSINGQRKSPTYEQYISNYNSLAIEQMKRYKIPASITLAQGLLESGAGQGTLTREGNNHFGIKCHDWRGDKIYKDDDAKNECFRKYKKAIDSYEDHSRFLTDRPRYKDLFRLKSDDYRGWARELQRAGYATDKAYANKLIKLIEDYELYLYDNKKYSESKKELDPLVEPPKKEEEKIIIVNKHTPYKTQGLVYVVAKSGDTFESIAYEFSVNPKKLHKYNEVPKEFPLKEGDFVFFKKKRSKALSPYYEHLIKVGESMHSISQKYGMSVKNLYKMNKKDFEYIPVEGDILKLR